MLMKMACEMGIYTVISNFLGGLVGKYMTAIRAENHPLTTFEGS
jgi:hypothetical protein